MPQQLLPFWNAFKRWWWLIVISVILAGVSGYVYWKGQPPVYQARIALMVGNSAQSQNPDAEILGIERTLATFYGEMSKRQPITQAVINRLGLSDSMKPADLGAAIETNVVASAQILEIYVYDYDAQRAASLATAIAEELINQTPSATSGNTPEFIRSQIADLEQKIQEVDAQLIDLGNRMATMTSASDLNEARATVTELEALKQTYSNNYLTYLGVLNNRSVNSLSIIEPAIVPNESVSTGVTITLLIAVAGGVALSIGAIVLLEYTDNVLRWGDIVVENGLPVLGIVPTLGRKQSPLIVKAQPNTAEADAVRSLRTRIFLADSSAMIKRLLVTSPSPRDGKSFTTVNLAVAAADAGLRVIIVDGDVRAGSIHQYFGCEREPGLTNLLWNQALDQAGHLSLLRRTSISNLQVLTAGTYARDPLVLLRSSRLAQLMDELSERADLVIIDSPPVTAGPIAALLSSAADAIVLVASIDRTNRKLFNFSRDELIKNAEAPLLGVALNRVSLGKLSPDLRLYGYGYSYGRQAPPKNLLERLQRLPAAAFGQVSRLLRFGRNGHLPGAASQVWLEETPGNLILDTPEAESPAGAPAAPATAKLNGDSEIMTLAEAALQLDVPEETIEEWCRTGQLPSVRIGRRWLVTGLKPQSLPALESDA